MDNQNDKIGGACGLYCNGCTIFIGTKEEPERLKFLAERIGQTINDLKCEGCQSNVLTGYCRSCNIKQCVKKKNINFCSECNEFPCKEILNFSNGLPHRLEVIESLSYHKKNGTEKWYNKMKKDYSCTKCGEINSAYDLKCRVCGNIPGNEFVKRNNDAIIKALKK